jgi:SAM-dependent methyltransferase
MQARDWDRLAANYYSEVISPLEKGTPRPLARALDRIPDARRKTVGDLGCGLGALLPTLAARFRRVVGIDFSPAMLARARSKCRTPRVSLHRADLADLDRFRGKLDVAVTVNAVLTTDPERLERIFAALRTTLRPGGVLLGIFPAMEAVLYQGLLIDRRERRRTSLDPARARARTAAALGARSYDFVHGIYREDGQTQKLFYAFELDDRLRRAGFRAIRLARLPYEWDNVGGFESFPGEAPMWDWLVRAEAQKAITPRATSPRSSAPNASPTSSIRKRRVTSSSSFNLPARYRPRRRGTSRDMSAEP